MSSSPHALDGMRNRLHLPPVVLLAGVRPLPAEPRAVIELFTSQGCSSCPPADKLRASSRAIPSLVTMSLAVDYWDYLGWKDTLALPAIPTANAPMPRCAATARSIRRRWSNGAVHVLGSDKAAIERAIADAERKAARCRCRCPCRWPTTRYSRTCRPARTSTATRRSGSVRSPRPCRSRSARRELRSHPHLPQRGAAAGSSSASGPAWPTFSLPLQRFSGGRRIDRRGGGAERRAPGVILGRDAPARLLRRRGIARHASAIAPTLIVEKKRAGEAGPEALGD